MIFTRKRRSYVAALQVNTPVGSWPQIFRPFHAHPVPSGCQRLSLNTWPPESRMTLGKASTQVTLSYLPQKACGLPLSSSQMPSHGSACSPHTRELRKESKLESFAPFTINPSLGQSHECLGLWGCSHRPRLLKWSAPSQPSHRRSTHTGTAHHSLRSPWPSSHEVDGKKIE